MLKLVSVTYVLLKDRGVFVQIKPIVILLFFILKQVSGQIRFVRLWASQKDPNLFLSESYLLFTSILKSPTIAKFSFLPIGLLIIIAISWKNKYMLLAVGDQYIQKHIYFFLRNCEFWTNAITIFWLIFH